MDIDSEASAESLKRTAKRSSVSYPYFDHDTSLEVARKIHSEAGGSCEADRLASMLSYKTTKSGTFQTRLSAAKQFGYVRADGPLLSVTERANQALHPVLPEDAIRAKCEAFLSVELFSKVYDTFKNISLPAKTGLRNLFQQTYGLGEDRLEPAIRVMMDSAQQTGFIHNGDQSRLIKPSTWQSPSAQTAPALAQTPAAAPQPAVQAEHRAHQQSSGEAPAGVHTAIAGLLRELPPPGANWPKRGKARFVKAFLATLDFVYPDEEEPDIDTQ